MNRKLAILLAGAVIGGGLAAWWIRSASEPPVAGVPPIPPTAEPAFDTGQLEPSPPTTEESVVDEPEPPVAGPPARRIRHGTAAPQETDSKEFSLPPSGNEKSDALARQVEKALAGDTDQLIALGRLVQSCNRGMASEEQVLRRLERMAQFSAQMPGGLPPRADGGSVEYQSFEELENATWARFDECQASKDILNEDLREQIERLAEAGIPSARYLYAIWSPGQYAFGTVDALEMLEYQTQALEYTWMNMQQREPLGLLAMAQSYSAFRPSMFTPSNPLQGQVFLLAAMKCGIDNDWLSERAVNFEQGVSRFQAENTRLPSLDEDATSLAKAFCPLPKDPD